MGFFSSFNPLSILSGGGGGGGGGNAGVLGSSGMGSVSSGGIGSSTGNTNVNATDTQTSNVDRRLVIGEGAIGVASDAAPVTLNIYGSPTQSDALAGQGAGAVLNGTTPGGVGTFGAARPAIGAQTDWAALWDDYKVWIIGGGVALVAGVAMMRGKA